MCTFYVVLLLLVAQVTCRPIPRDENVAYSLYTLDELEKRTYTFRSFLYEQVRHNSLDNIVASVENKLKAVGIDETELKEIKRELEDSLAEITSNMKLIENSLWWISTYIDLWRDKIQRCERNRYVAWHNFNKYVHDLQQNYVTFTSKLLPRVTHVYRHVSVVVENKLEEPEKSDDVAVVRGGRDLNEEQLQRIQDVLEIQTILNQSLNTLKQREFSLAIVKAPWDEAVIHTLAALFSMFNVEIVRDFVSPEDIQELTSMAVIS